MPLSSPALAAIIPVCIVGGGILICALQKALERWCLFRSLKSRASSSVAPAPRAVEERQQRGSFVIGVPVAVVIGVYDPGPCRGVPQM